MRSATLKAPRTSWVTITLVTPSSWSSRFTSSSMMSALTGSRPEVGSSYRRYFGAPAIARDRIETGGWLVVQEVFRRAGDRPSDAHALAHTTGKLGRKLVHRFGSQVDQFETFRHAGPGILQIIELRHIRQPEPNVLEDVHGIEQGAVLEYIADPGAELGQFLPMQRGDLAPVHHHLAGVGTDETVDVLEQHALAGAGRPEEREGLSFPHFEVHPVEDHLLAEAFLDPAQLDHAVSRNLARSALMSRITTELATIAAVVDFPTPSAPCLVLKPM